MVTGALLYGYAPTHTNTLTSLNTYIDLLFIHHTDNRHKDALGKENIEENSNANKILCETHVLGCSVSGSLGSSLNKRGARLPQPAETVMAPSGV